MQYILFIVALLLLVVGTFGAGDKQANYMKRTGKK